MVAAFKLHAAANDVAFSDDGRYLAVASSDNQVHVFPFNSDKELIKQVKDRIVGDKIKLEDSECDQYMHKKACDPLPY